MRRIDVDHSGDFAGEEGREHADERTAPGVPHENVRRAQIELREQPVQLLRDMPWRRRPAVGFRESDAGAIVRDGARELADLVEHRRPGVEAGPGAAFEHYDRPVRRMLQTDGPYSD